LYSSHTVKTIAGIKHQAIFY